MDNLPVSQILIVLVLALSVLGVFSLTNWVNKRWESGLDIYSHVTPDLQQAAALRFEESLATYADSEPSVEAVWG